MSVRLLRYVDVFDRAIVDRAGCNLAATGRARRWYRPSAPRETDNGRPVRLGNDAWMPPLVADGTPEMQALNPLLEVIAPGSRAVAVHPLAGSYSNHSHRVDVVWADGRTDQFVTRRYVDHGEAPRRKAIREF